jgi:hypothetical protein
MAVTESDEDLQRLVAGILYQINERMEPQIQRPLFGFSSAA